MIEQAQTTTDQEPSPATGETGLRALGREAAPLYGLFAVLLVAAIQVFFSMRSGGYFAEQWYWGAAAVAVSLVGAAFVPGYFSSASLGRKQWALAGALFLLTAVSAASVLWSISPGLSVDEASRTAMYAGAFVLLLPAAARWGRIVVDATIFGALMPPAVYGLLQKVYPMTTAYTGIGTLETDAKASSTLGYHPTFGMMCAMGALLAVSRVESFRSLRSIPLRALFSAAGTVFLVALYLSFSRGALLAFAAGAVVLLALSGRRFEALGNVAISGLPALWVIWEAREMAGLVSRPVGEEVMRADGAALLPLLGAGMLIAVVGQVVFSFLVWTLETYTPRRVSTALKVAGSIVVAGVILFGALAGWAKFQELGGLSGVGGQISGEDSSLTSESVDRNQTNRLFSLDNNGRIGLWKIALGNWREHPLTGTGGDTFQVVYAENPQDELGDVLHPHSMWMSLLSDTGIFAFLAFLAFSAGSLGIAAYNALFTARKLPQRPLIVGSAAAMAAYLASSSVDWNWYIPASTLPFFVLTAVAVAISRRGGEKDSDSERESTESLKVTRA